LADAFEERNLADYAPGAAFDRTRAEEWLRRGREFLRQAEDRLREEGPEVRDEGGRP